MLLYMTPPGKHGLGPSSSGTFVGSSAAKPHKGKAPGPEGCRRAAHVGCPGDSTASSAEVWGGDGGLSGNHGAEFQRAEARSREFQYRIVQ